MSDLYNLSNLKIGDWIWFEIKSQNSGLKLGKILAKYPYMKDTFFVEVKDKEIHDFKPQCQNH